MNKEKNNTFFLLVFFLSSIFLSLKPALSEKRYQSRNIIGQHGILEMPVAGSINDGEIGFTVSTVGAINQNVLSFQALPRVYGALRYTGVGNTSSSYYENSGYSYWDRGFDLRIDILDESKFFPDVSVGMHDIVGGGTFSSEYLVASKSLFKKLRISTGLGWGELSSNQITSTGRRTTQENNSGGNLKYKHLFRGAVGVFGGIEYETPIEKLRMKLEYSSNSRKRTSHWWKNVIKDDKINYGVDYFITDSVSLSAYKAYGNEIGLQLNLSGSPLQTYSGEYLEPIPEPFYSFPLKYKKTDMSYIDDLKNSFKKKKINLIAHKIKKNEIIVVIDNYHFSSNSQAVGRSLRLLSKFVPHEIKKFTVILSEVEIPVAQLSFDRDEVAAIVDAPNAEYILEKIVSIKPAPKSIPGAIINQSNKRSSQSILPYYKLHLFDPDNPIYYDLGPRLSLSYKIKPGIEFNFSGVKSLYTTFDKIKRGEKGSLPKVRTKLKHYRNEIGARIENMTVSSYFKFSEDVLGRITAGYLEEMYAGISTEMLYFPIKKNISFSTELNYVQAREFRQLLNLREENGLSKINGHISAYWDTGYYDYLAQLDYGKYLAGDIGSTLTLSRNFKNGWKAGGFFTLTDASFKSFGEGSFDKGIFFTIPFNPIIPYETRASISELIRPIQGDGGARLIVPGRLYERVKQYSENQILGTWPRIWR